MGSPRALAGITVLEIAGGTAGAYCGRLLADAGALVTVLGTAADRGASGARADMPTENLHAAYLSAGKTRADSSTVHDFSALTREFDLVVIGEDATVDLGGVLPRMATVSLTWFGTHGPYSKWKASDLIIQALTGMPHLAGAIEGPPVHGGDRHSALIGGVTAYIAAIAGIVAKSQGKPQHFAVNLLEANMVLSEMDIHFVERDGVPLTRHGVNRFSPNGPVGVYPCKDGWVGIIATTPAQWLSLCTTLGMDEQRADAGLATRELRFQRLDEVEEAMVALLAHRTAEEWAALGREHRIPIVLVPDAAGILRHPIFKARQSLASFATEGRSYRVPRTPFGLTKTPTATQLARDMPGSGTSSDRSEEAVHTGPPLSGIVVVDFAMGWAGPLTSRLLGDLGADILKIEAGRYPDWWRGVNWTPEYVANRQYENAKGFCALNRGKRGVSIDLTTLTGRDLALSLISKADAVVENQAAGVMAKLGLGYEQLAAVNPEVVMLSMSAFGVGNAWSDTRAYGSTLEQGSGLPRFTGFPDAAPTMAHLAYGDPVGGLFGCAAALTALAYRKRGGTGQLVNLSMIEAMLQFTTSALLEYQVTGCEPIRRGNRHPAMAPHNIYPGSGQDRWLAIAIEDAEAFYCLARVIGRPDWIGNEELATLDGRKKAEDEIDRATRAWSCTLAPEHAASQLQAAGVCAAPVVHTEDILRDPHLAETGFFIDLTREFSGPQRQCGSAISKDGERLRSASPAPLLGEHSQDVLNQYLGTDRDSFDAMVRDNIICFEPKAMKGEQSTSATKASQLAPVGGGK